MMTLVFKGVNTMKKVLMVDNDRLMLEFMDDLLKKKGYHIITAGDGLTALDLLSTEAPDVIFVDLVMPNIDGKKLCTIIREKEELKDAYLFILSSILGEEEINVSELGANGYIEKGPFKKMAKFILDVLEQTEHASSRELTGKKVAYRNIYPRGITQELLSVKRHFELILETMTEGILEITAEGRIIYANPIALELIKLPEKELLGADFGKLFSKDDQTTITNLLKSLGDEPVQIGEDAPVVLNDLQTTLNILPIPGDPATIIVILNDVTQRKIMEEKVRIRDEQLKDANKRLWHAYAQMRDWKDELSSQLTGEEIGFLVNETGEIQGVTEKALQVTGKTRNILLKANILDIVHEDSKAELNKELKKASVGVFRQMPIRMTGLEKDDCAYEAKLMLINLASGKSLLILLREEVK
jgi:PAS domain S-box-containing protein